jgi:hypothetical protein
MLGNIIYKYNLSESGVLVSLRGTTVDVTEEMMHPELG